MPVKKLSTTGLFLVYFLVYYSGLALSLPATQPNVLITPQLVSTGQNSTNTTLLRFAYPDGLSIIYQFNMLPESEYNTIVSYQAALSAAQRAIRDATFIHSNSDQPLGRAKFYTSGPFASRSVILSIRPDPSGMNWKEWGDTAKRVYEFIQKEKSKKVFDFYVFKDGVKGMIGEGIIRPGSNWPGIVETE